MTQRKLLRGSLIILLGTFGIKFALLLKDMYLSKEFGISLEYSIYLTAFVIPAIFSNQLGAAFQVVTTAKLVDEKSVSWSFIRDLFTKLLIISVVSYGILYPLLGEIFSFSDIESANTLRRIFLLFFPYLLLTPLRTFLGQVLFVNGHYAFNFIPAFFSPFFVIGYLVFYPDASVDVLAIILVLTVIIEMICILGKIWHERLLARGGSEEGLGWKQIGEASMIQVFVGSNLLVDQVFAQRAGETFLGVFNYASKLPNLIASVTMVVTSSVLLPFFQERLRVNEGMKLHFGKKMILRLAAVAAITLAFYSFSDLITSILFERGKFTHEDVEAVSSIQKVYFLMAPLTALFLAYIRYLGTTMKTRKAMTYGFLSFIGVCITDTVLLNTGLVQWIPLAVLPGYAFVVCIELIQRKTKSA